MAISTYQLEQHKLDRLPTPPAVVWEPGVGRERRALRGNVRTITYSNEGKGVRRERRLDLARSDGSGAGTRPRRSMVDHLTTYLVGGAFGLSVVLGAVLLTDEEVDSTVGMDLPSTSVAAR